MESALLSFGDGPVLEIGEQRSRFASRISDATLASTLTRAFTFLLSPPLLLRLRQPLPRLGAHLGTASLPALRRRGGVGACRAGHAFERGDGLVEAVAFSFQFSQNPVTRVAPQLDLW